MAKAKTKSKSKHGDCYSAGERRFMILGQQIRQVLFKPLLQMLVACNVTPNQVTVASLFAGLFGIVAFYYSSGIALLLLLLHVLLDGIDGPLARMRRMASNAGSITDSAVDQLVLTGTCFVLIDLGIVTPFIGGLHALLYTVVVIFAMVRNHLSIPYRFLLRPRFFVYLLLVVEFYYQPGIMNIVLMCLNFGLAFHCITGFFRIRQELS